MEAAWRSVEGARTYTFSLDLPDRLALLADLC